MVVFICTNSFSIRTFYDELFRFHFARKAAKLAKKEFFHAI
jgi:hypothetical protein